MITINYRKTGNYIMTIGVRMFIVKEEGDSGLR